MKRSFFYLVLVIFLPRFAGAGTIGPLIHVIHRSKDLFCLSARQVPNDRQQTLHFEACDGSEVQNWTFRYYGRGAYRLMNPQVQKCVILTSPLRLGNCSDDASEQWRFWKAGNDLYHLQNISNGACSDNGDIPKVVACNDSTEQKVQILQ